MDTLTHALSGALLARATTPSALPSRAIPRRVAAGFFACAAPDLDFVIGFFGPVEYLQALNLARDVASGSKRLS